MIFPSLKSGQKELTLVRRDILYSHSQNFYPYSATGRFLPAIIDILANKYKAGIDNYKKEDDNQAEDLLLLGFNVCAAQSRLKCVAQQKVAQFLERTSKVTEDIYGIYIPVLDDTDENRQQFILLGQQKLYHRNSSLNFDAYPYTSLIVHSDGLAQKGDGEMFLERELEPRFTGFLNELLVLNRPPIQSLQSRHPMQDELLRANDTAGGNRAEKYVALMIIAALAGGQLTAHKLLMLESLALTLRIPQNVFYNLVTSINQKGISPNTILSALNEALDELGRLPRTVCYLDVLQFSVDDNGKVVSEKVIEVLSRDRFAGKSFVRNYLEFLENDSKAWQNLSECFALEDEKSQRGLLAQQEFAKLNKLYLLKK